MAVPEIDDIYICVIINHGDGSQTQMLWTRDAVSLHQQLVRMFGAPTHHVIITPESLQDRLDLFESCSVLVQVDE